jgi:hypothetical protein
VTTHRMTGEDVVPAWRHHSFGGKGFSNLVDRNLHRLGGEGRP